MVKPRPTHGWWVYVVQLFSVIFWVGYGLDQFWPDPWQHYLDCYTTTLLQLHVNMQTCCHTQPTSQAAPTQAVLANSGSEAQAANQLTTHGPQGPYKKKQTLADNSQSDGNKENKEEVSESEITRVQHR